MVFTHLSNNHIVKSIAAAVFCERGNNESESLGMFKSI